MHGSVSDRCVHLLIQYKLIFITTSWILDSNCTHLSLYEKKVEIVYVIAVLHKCSIVRIQPDPCNSHNIFLLNTRAFFIIISK